MNLFTASIVALLSVVNAEPLISRSTCEEAWQAEEDFRMEEERTSWSAHSSVHLLALF